jgi:hypothetical protein
MKVEVAAAVVTGNVAIVVAEEKVVGLKQFLAVGGGIEVTDGARGDCENFRDVD